MGSPVKKWNNLISKTIEDVERIRRRHSHDVEEDVNKLIDYFLRSLRAVEKRRGNHGA